MPTRFKIRARETAAVAVFALALCLSSCTRTQQTNSLQTHPHAQSSPTPADQQTARRGADSRWWIRVRGDGPTVAFTEDGVRKKELPRMPRLSEFSPDGSRLLEVRFANGMSDIFIADADGSHARKIVRGVSAEDEAHWSHDGARILYASSRGGFHLFEADARGKVLRKFARGNVIVADPLYTPDGRISYIFRRVPTEQRRPSPDIVGVKRHLPSDIVVADGATERVVVEDRPISAYAWDSSGRRLAFGTYEDGGLIVMRDLAGGTERVVKLSDIDERLAGFVAHEIRWRPDGGTIAFLLSFTGGRGQDEGVMFGERQLFVLYPDGRATWFDVEEAVRSIFDWIPADDLLK